VKRLQKSTVYTNKLGEARSRGQEPSGGAHGVAGAETGNQTGSQVPFTGGVIVALETQTDDRRWQHLVPISGHLLETVSAHGVAPYSVGSHTDELAASLTEMETEAETRGEGDSEVKRPRLTPTPSLVSSEA